jgi:hypothetical protein
MKISTYHVFGHFRTLILTAAHSGLWPQYSPNRHYIGIQTVFGHFREDTRACVYFADSSSCGRWGKNMSDFQSSATSAPPRGDSRSSLSRSILPSA